MHLSSSSRMTRHKVRPRHTQYNTQQLNRPWTIRDRAYLLIIIEHTHCDQNNNNNKIIYIPVCILLTGSMCIYIYDIVHSHFLIFILYFQIKHTRRYLAQKYSDRRNIVLWRVNTNLFLTHHTPNRYRLIIRGCVLEWWFSNCWQGIRYRYLRFSC